MRPFGFSSFALSVLFSSLRQAPSQGRHYTSSYMKNIQHFTALIGIEPRLQPELRLSLKNLGIAKVIRGCRGGLKVKNRWINQNTNLNIPVRITSSPHGNTAKQCHQKQEKNSSIRDSKNLITINLVSKLSVEVPLRKLCSFSLLNCRSTCNKTQAIKDYVVDRQLDIVALTETWLRPDPHDSLTIGDLTPNGYRFIHIPRVSDSRGGGVGLLFNNSLQFSLNQDSSALLRNLKSCEVMDLQLDYHRLSRVHLLVVYRPPSASTSLFLDEFGTLLEYYTTVSGALIMVGDFNLRIDMKSDPVVKKFLHLLDSFNLVQSVNSSTHRAGHILDLIITRNDENILGPVSVHDSGISDHFNVNCGICLNKPKVELKVVLSRKIKSIDIERFKLDVAGALDPGLSDDVFVLSSKYHSELSRILDSHAPLRKRCVSGRPATPWYNNEIKAAKRQRRRFERRWRRTKDPADRRNYLDQCIIVANQLRASRERYYSNLIDSFGKDQKKLFGTFSKLLHNVPEKLYPRASSNKDLAEKFMTFFDSKVRVIRLELDTLCATTPSMPAEEDILDFSMDTFDPVSVSFFLDLVKLSVGKSCDLDPIPGCVLRECLVELGPILTKIVNLSLASAVMPMHLKTALIRPLLKKPSLDHLQFKNFRPISNLQFLSKAIEKVVAHQLLAYLDKHNLQETFQSAYKRNHSSETALIRVHNDILTAIDNHQSVILVLLDISAAFDTIDHQLLLGRLESRFGVKGKVLAWFSSYLSGRRQFTKIENSVSSHYSLRLGVPQGSILGPLLYTLYTSPLGDIARCHDLSFHLYADDTQLYITFNSLDSATVALRRLRLEACVNEINQWMVCNRLKLNGDKSELLVLSSIYRPRPDLISVDIAGQQISPASSARNIGFVFDEAMSFIPQVTNVCKVVCFHLRGIYKIRNFLSYENTVTLVHAFISSRLDYCNSLLFGLPDFVIKRLQLVQNAAARLVCMKRKYDHVTPLLVELHWLPVNERIKFKILLMTFKILHCNAPVYLSDLVERYIPVRALRSATINLLVKPRFNQVTYGGRSFAVAAPTLWNDLPSDIRACSTLLFFKKKLKTFLFKKTFSL